MELEEMKQKIIELPKKKKEQDMLIRAFTRTLIELAYKKKGIELEVYKEICNEKVDGKAVFTNKESRDAEQYRKLRSHPEYDVFTKEELDILHKKQDAETEYYYLKDEFKALGFLVTIIGVER